MDGNTTHSNSPSTRRVQGSCTVEGRQTTRVPSWAGSTFSMRTSSSVMEMPINMKFVFEGMEENGSDMLDKFIAAEKDKFFTGIDCMCISGQLSFCVLLETQLTIFARRQLLARHEDALPDIWSARYQLLRDPSIWPGSRSCIRGRFGGAIHEPMTDLILLSEFAREIERARMSISVTC